MNKTVHHGRNVKRFREMLGIKQDTLASDMGEDWNQKKVSMLEAKELIDDGLLDQIAVLLKVPTEAIKNFDEEAAVNIISNTFNSHDNSTLNAINPNCVFNALEKLIEVMDEKEKLYNELIRSEREKNALLHRMINEKK